MIRKDPPLDQTGGLRDKEKEGSMHHPALHLNKLPGVHVGLPQGLNLDRCLPVSLLLQRNLCRLPVRWRIIAVTELKIVEWHNYKHLDWISVHRDDDKIYKFKEGDLKRLRLQDIEDMLLLIVQGKLSNLTVEERFAFNVSLRMFTRSIVIQRRMEDL
nr:hypothetical protein [Tanacetum cinerariifolium]